MFVDTLAIAYRIHIRHWYMRRFAALQRERVGAAAREEILEADRIVPPAGALDLTGDELTAEPVVPAVDEEIRVERFG
jgi:hypothetical protein